MDLTLDINEELAKFRPQLAPAVPPPPAPDPVPTPQEAADAVIQNRYEQLKAVTAPEPVTTQEGQQVDRILTDEELDALLVGDDPPDALDRKIPASIRTRNPGAMWPGPSSRLFGQTGKQVLRDGQNNQIAHFPTYEAGAAALFHLYERRYTGKTLRDAIKTWSGGNSSEVYAQKMAKSLGVEVDHVLTVEDMRNPELAIRFARTMSGHEAGKGYPMTESQWTNAHRLYVRKVAGGVTDPAIRAANLFKDLSNGLAAKLARDPADHEVRLGFAFGIEPAARLAGAYSTVPDEAAARVLPDVAKQFPTLFYHDLDRKKPKTISEMVRLFGKKDPEEE